MSTEWCCDWNPGLHHIRQAFCQLRFFPSSKSVKFWATAESKGHAVLSIPEVEHSPVFFLPFFSLLIFCWVLVTKEYWTKANWTNRILNFNRAVGMDQTWAGQAFWLVPEGRHKGTEEVNELWFSWPSLDIRIPFLYIHVSPLILWRWKLTSTLIFYQRNGLI